ncbi:MULTISPECIES: succinyldiaminopimelate transaminase [unclassified Isoptericola]|uniref:succinyldiaminopimelate transaminase n=1 Tax=unclassified Isoptericola TaxID=2623355 RepID=UPI0027124153|nr:MULTISPECIES: succinyldiaminopimelate transaminase [unclassified Isoptericola]MDO8144318.1 succinyldiaminopimelate transaminase [Isoptericola sp. 178]MDO8148172.1 succinyldiaminopimelate transaminase [Isoptericola sp. b515]MDO8151649.1 succinyldiaminopimelate transaminase [Isoptericola sp. b408]
MGFADLRDLPYPWDTLGDVRSTAAAHPGGMVDLSVGTPVDPTPQVVQDALRTAADAPGYPTTHGTPALRETVVDWFARRRGVPGLDPAGVLPTVGSKELVGLLPSLLRLGPGDVVVHPAVAYPTYDVGARLAGATALPSDDVATWAGRADVRLVWVNSPSNPTGAVADVEHLRAVVAAAREIGAVVVSDECYAELAWDAPWAGADGVSTVPSLLDPRVTDGSLDGLLVAYSASKQSNIAGYRAAFVAGDSRLVADLVATRKHLGMIMPAPVQEALRAALRDDAHVDAQRERYRRRRAALLPALRQAGFVVDHSEAGLYLWARWADGAADGTTSRDLARWFATRGILVGPGEFYGVAGGSHVRVALTAADDAVTDAVARLTSS